MLIVQKYGGSSVADENRIANVAKRVVSARKKDNKVVVVVSAMGDTTDELIEQAMRVNPNSSKREMDALLATGEQRSCALLAMAIQRLGYSAVSLDAWLAGISTTSSHGNARIKSIDTERINLELDNNHIVVIAGFQGVNRRGDFTTLGRGGSDTSAVALAAALKAHICEIYTDVPGIFSADPRIVKNARMLASISYFEMLELAALGANVLAKRSVGLAKKYGVKLVVKSSMEDGEGTVIKEESRVEGTLISGVTLDRDIVRINMSGINDGPGVWFKLFDLMNQGDISIDFLRQTKKVGDVIDISFTVSKTDLSYAMEIIKDNNKLAHDSAYHQSGLAKISVVSAGMSTNPTVPSLMLEALYDIGISVDSLSTSEIRASVLIDEKEAEKAVSVVHEKFEQGKYIRG